MKPKLVIFLAILMVFVCIPSFAAVRTATFGNQNSNGIYRIVSDSDGLVTFAADTSIKFPYQSGTTNDTLTAADSGRTYVIGSGSTSGVHMTLPAAAVGMEFTFVADTTDYIMINPNGTDIINYASLSAGDTIYNSSISKGDSITLFCAVVNTWSVKNMNGTWADGGDGPS